MNSDYDIEYLVNVIEYNKQKLIAFRNQLPFKENIEYERILKARYNKNNRIKQRFIYLLSRYKNVWFCTFTFNDHYINKSDRTQKDLIKSCINTYDFKYILYFP